MTASQHARKHCVVLKMGRLVRKLVVTPLRFVMSAMAPAQTRLESGDAQECRPASTSCTMSEMKARRKEEQ